MTAPTFKPSEVVLHVPPLVGTMKRSEVECGAAALVRVCVRLGDTWQPVLPLQLGEALAADVEEKVEPFSALWLNPFVYPDVVGLVRLGFARYVGGDPTDLGDAEERRRAVEFTDAGFEALARWVRS